MRKNLSKLESSILYHIDTGAGRSYVKAEVQKETNCEMNELNQAIKKLKMLGLIRYEDQGTYLVANFAHRKDMRFDQTLDVYTYDEGQENL